MFYFKVGQLCGASIILLMRTLNLLEMKKFSQDRPLGKWQSRGWKYAVLLKCLYCFPAVCRKSGGCQGMWLRWAGSGWGTRYRNEKGPGPRKPSTLDSKLNLPPGFLQSEVALVQLYFPGLLAWGWHPHFRLRLCVPAWRRWCGALYAPYGALPACGECSAVHCVSLTSHMPVKRRYIYLSPGSWVPAAIGLAPEQCLAGCSSFSCGQGLRALQ